jgi:hypothetical protein
MALLLLKAEYSIITFVPVVMKGPRKGPKKAHLEAQFCPRPAALGGVFGKWPLPLKRMEYVSSLCMENVQHMYGKCPAYRYVWKMSSLCTGMENVRLMYGKCLQFMYGTCPSVMGYLLRMLTRAANVLIQRRYRILHSFVSWSKQ